MRSKVPKPIKRFICFIPLMGIFLWHPASGLSKEVIIRSDDQFEFALQYMNKEDYARAITEFERFLYFFPDDEGVPKARFLIGMCHLKGKQYSEARKIFQDVYRDYSGKEIAEKALFLLGESYYQQGLIKEAGRYFKQVVEEVPRSEFRDEALYRLGWIELQGNDWQGAAKTFSSIENTSPLYAPSTDLAQRALGGQQLPYKDPVVAGVMAGILPGSGHAYCNRYRDGLVAFLLNAVFMWAAVEAFDQDHDALGGILTFMEAGWYAGNIYSAVNSAHKFNRKVRKDFLQGLPDNLDLNLFTSREGRLGIALRIDF